MTKTELLLASTARAAAERGIVTGGAYVCRPHPAQRKPADLAVLQSTNFKLVINAHPLRELGLCQPSCDSQQPHVPPDQAPHVL